jgi:hypothetical protein
MDAFGSGDGTLNVLVYVCIGYLFGTLIMSAAAITRGLMLLGHAGILKQPLVISFQALHAAVALAAVMVLPMLIGRFFEGRLSELGSILMLAVCAATVFVMARVLVYLGLFRSSPSA